MLKYKLYPLIGILFLTYAQANDNFIKYECLRLKYCYEEANNFLDNLNINAGKIFPTKRYSADDLANIAAAKLYSQASIDAKREPNWIIFRDDIE